MKKTPNNGVESWVQDVGAVSAQVIGAMQSPREIKQTSQLRWAAIIFKKVRALFKRSQISDVHDGPYAFYPLTPTKTISCTKHVLGRLAMYYLWDYWENESVCMEARVSELNEDLKLEIKETPKNIGNTFKSIGLRPVKPKKIEQAKLKRAAPKKVKRVPPQKAKRLPTKHGKRVASQKVMLKKEVKRVSTQKVSRAKIANQTKRLVKTRKAKA